MPPADFKTLMCETEYLAHEQAVRLFREWLTASEQAALLDQVRHKLVGVSISRAHAGSTYLVMPTCFLNWRINHETAAMVISTGTRSNGVRVGAALVAARTTGATIAAAIAGIRPAGAVLVARPQTA
jgi:hypothetical protein